MELLAHLNVKSKNRASSGIARSRHTSQVIRVISIPPLSLSLCWLLFQNMLPTSGKMTPKSSILISSALLERAYFPIHSEEMTRTESHGRSTGLFPQPWSWEGRVSHTGTPWTESVGRKVSQRKWRCWYQKREQQNSSQWKIEIYTLWSELRRLM